MTVVPYSVTRRVVWDDFVDGCRQGCFVFRRGYMDSYGDGVFDCSVMVCQGLTEDDDYKENELQVSDVVAVLPANWDEKSRTVISHGKLPYGGLLTREDATQVDVLRCMQLVMKYFRNYLGARDLLYKPTPYIYSSLPAEEDRYALFRAGAKLERRRVSTVVDQLHPLGMRNLRQNSARRAVDSGLYIERAREMQWDVLERFWGMLQDYICVNNRRPLTVTLDSLKEMMTKFPRLIRLYVVRDNDTEMVAGALVYELRQVAFVRYVASTRQGRDMGALDLLFRNLITERYKGMRYIDFGGSNSASGMDLDDSQIFMKEGFGGRSVCYDEYRVELKEYELRDMFRIDLPKDGSSGVKYLDLKRVTESYEPELSRAVKRVVESGWYLLGRENEQFASDWSRYIGVRHTSPCGNGLDALKLVFRSLRLLHGWQEGDGVLVQGNTYIATILAIRDAGLRPVLFDVDVNADDDIDRQKALVKLAVDYAEFNGIRLRAVCPVHLYGRVWNMDVFRSQVERHDLVVVEDCAQVHGGAWRGRKAGALGTAAAWSFYPGKNMGALGDGGCVTTDDDRLAETVGMMRNYGFREKYVCEMDGVNSRMDELQAAVLGVKLKRLDSDNERRREIARMYVQDIQNPLLKLPRMPKVDDECVWHIMPVCCAERDRLREYLGGLGIETLIHYPIPPHLQKTWVGEHVALPGAERLAREELSLPISPVMTDEEVGRVVEACRRFV